MKENPKAFIPAWLNNLGLSQAEFRVYCCLAARADIKTGIAWPEAKTIASDCAMAPNTVWKSIGSLEGEKKLIQKVGKPFGGSNRYRVLVPPIGANEIPIEEPPTVSNEIPIEAPPIVSNEIHQSYQMDSHQSYQMDRREGITNKSNQVRVTKGDFQELPFESDSFNEAWNEWQQHRREIKRKLTPTSIKKQLKELSAMGEHQAIAAINQSISKGWTGIFPTSETKKSHSPGSVSTTNRPATVNNI